MNQNSPDIWFTNGKTVRMIGAFFSNIREADAINKIKIGHDPITVGTVAFVVKYKDCITALRLYA